jgi:hypothetical protein
MNWRDSGAIIEEFLENRESLLVPEFCFYIFVLPCNVRRSKNKVSCGMTGQGNNYC